VKSPLQTTQKTGRGKGRFATEGGIPVLTMVILCGGLLAPGMLAVPSDCTSADYHPDRVQIPAPPPTGGLILLSPMEGTLFPRDMSPPRFWWRDEREEGRGWVIELEFADHQESLVHHASVPEWTPSKEDWERIKGWSLEKPVKFRLRRQGRTDPSFETGCACVSFRTSRDAVEASIFYREIGLPMVESARSPSQIRWRIGTVDSMPSPRVVMQDLPVCANCHSFSRDAGILGLDIDHRSKGTYALACISPEMRLTEEDMIDWEDFAPGTKSFGLLSQVSPDGRFAVSTVRDVSVFVQRRELAFSQLFFPVQGILAFYDRDKRVFQALSGADDPEYVQTNPVWSPDGREVVFARSRAFQFPPDVPSEKRAAHLEHHFGRECAPFQYDLYRLPFNGGRGGRLEPVMGASANGRSNFFPKYSPDGKWIVFCQAGNYMMLQPDSELYIIPARGGTARRLAANTSRMNSWHSWSPNSKWLVFSSKAQSDMTQLFLTHVDEQGNSSPPVLLERFHEPGYAANIPEFLPASPFPLPHIEASFAPELRRIAAGHDRFKQGDISGVIDEYRKAVALAPGNPEARQSLGLLQYYFQADREEALAHMIEAVRLAPNNPYLHHDLGMMQLHQGNLDLAVSHLLKAVNLWQASLDPASEYSPNSAQYQQGLMLSPRHRRNRLLNPEPEMAFHLGLALFLKGEFKASARHFRNATFADGAPNHDATFRYLLALALASEGELKEAGDHYRLATTTKPSLNNSLQLSDLLGSQCALADRFLDLVRMAREKLLGNREFRKAEFNEALLMKS